ncbi:MAG: NAD-dependent epimerase/dehydratase family protein, partial [Aeoliella sp.]
MNQYEKLPDQTILVTGSNGFIGRHLVSTLQEIEGVRLILLSRSRPDALPNGATWISQSLEKVTESTWAEVGVSQFDVVFHLAGFTRKSRDRSNDLKSNFDDNLVA